MSISGINGGPNAPRPTQRVLSENVAPAIAQAVGPQDILGIKTKREPGNGLSASTRLADLKPEQMSSLGGGSALQTIADSQPGTTVGEVGPLLRNSAALDSIANLMQNRRDLKVGDFVTRDPKGRVQIDPSYKDDQTMELLKERSDITPSQLSAMKQNFTRTLKNPQLGKMAAEKSFGLLKKRTDLTPEDMGNLMGSLRTAAGGDNKNKAGGGAGDDAGAMAALEMFDSASKLMGERTDLKPDQVGEVAQSVGNLSSPKDKQGPQNVAEGFASAAKSMQQNSLRTPTEMSKMASTVGEHFKGGDEKTAGHRMNAFKKSSEMMGENTSIDHNSVNKMLTQATERDPKIKNGEGPGRAKRLAKVMDNVSDGVKSGTVNANDLSSHFRNQDAERARFKADTPEETKKKEMEKAAQSGVEDDKKSKPGEQAKADEKAKPGEEAKTAPSQVAKANDEEETKITDSQQQEKGAQPSSDPGQAPDVSKDQVAQSTAPGQAAGTSDAGIPKDPTPATGSTDKKAGQTGQQPGAKQADAGGAAAAATVIQPKGPQQA